MAGTATTLGDRTPLTTRGDLTLQICGTSRAGQIVRLKSEKCSIGSGEHCTLRVRARSVKPLHCVIFRGQTETLVRSWAPDTRLNGRTFSDARLSPGDRISVGTVEFEVLDPTDKRIQHGETSDSRKMPPAATPRPADGTGTAGQDDLERLTSRLVLANHQGRARVRRLLGQLRTAKANLAHLQQQPTSPSAGENSAAPANAQQQTIARQSADQQQALEAEREQWETARREAEEQLAGRAKQLDEQMVQLEVRQAALRRQRNEWDASRAEAEEQLVVRAAKVDKREAELDERLAELRNTPAAATVRARDSASSGPLPQDDGPLTNQQTEDGSVESPGADRTHPSQSGSKPSGGVSVDDESVEQYMARLLGRVGNVAHGKDTQPKAKTFESQPSVDSSARGEDSKLKAETSGPQPLVAFTASVSAPPAAEEQLEAEPVAESAPAGRSDSPDHNRQASQTESDQDPDVAAAPNLANFSAEEAIDRQWQGWFESRATGQLLVTFLALIGGIISTWGWVTGWDPFYAIPGTIGSFAVAAFSGFWYLLLICNTARLDMPPEEPAVVPEPDDDDSPQEAS